MKKMEVSKRNLLLLAAVIITVVLLSTYGVATYFDTSHATTNYDLTIYLDETEDADAQLDEIGALLKMYYKGKLSPDENRVVMPIISQNVNRPQYVETSVADIHLQDIVSLLESNGYQVTYKEQ